MAENAARSGPITIAAPKRHTLTKALLVEVLSACSSLRDFPQVFSQVEEALDNLLIRFTPLDLRRLQTTYKESLRKAWNWFHTLTDRKPPVKPDSRETNTLHPFSCFLPVAWIRQPDCGYHPRFGVLNLRRSKGSTIARRTEQGSKPAKASLLWKQFQEKRRFARLPRPPP